MVLLIDDPYLPKTAAAREQLEAARALPCEIAELLARPASRFARALDEFEASRQREEPLGLGSVIVLAGLYDEAATWLEQLAADQEIIDHTDTFFASEVILRLAGSLRAIETAVLASTEEGVVLEQQMFRRLYRRLVWTFRADVSSFERKRYVSLSHEPNKAMNLNSYIGLMGGSYREVQTVTGIALVRSQPDDPAPEHPGPGLRGDAGCGQRAAARILPAARAPAGAERVPRHGDRPDSLQRLPRLGDPAGADRRRDHGPAAHRPPGPDLLRRHLLGRRERGDPQAGPRRHRGDVTTSATGRSGITSRTAPSSRTPNPPSTWAPTAGGCTTARSG